MAAAPDPDAPGAPAAIAALALSGERDRAAGLALAALLRGVAQPQLLAPSLAARRAARPAGLTADDAAPLWGAYGGALARAGQLAAARTALGLALALDPDDVAALADAGTAAFIQADLAEAKRHFTRAATLDPGHVDALAALAAIAAREGDPEAARARGQLVLGIAPGHPAATIAVARADLLLGDPAAAATRLDALLARPELPEANRVGALDLRAEARDRLDDPAAAFADYAARNAILVRQYAPRIAREVPERRPAQAARLARYFAAAPPAWRTAPPAGRCPARGHAFILGFPRSGTTLLEKALAGHPAIVTLEEVDHLSAIAGEHLASDDALTRFAQRDSAGLDALRDRYWAAVAAAAGGTSDRIVVDKLPLHSVALPLIARLFPEARILLALRDPRDVVLSAFRRRFQINAAMFELLTLEGAARYYDAVMALVAQYRRVLPLDLREVRHEAMVADFDSELRAVLDFLGAGWDPAVRDFAARARARAVTPSDLQLGSGLNAEGVGQWRRYRDALTPVQPLLARWVVAFGYAPD